MRDQMVHIYVIVVWAKDDQGGYHNLVQGPEPFFVMPPIPRHGDLVAALTDDGVRHLSVDFIEYSYVGLKENGSEILDDTLVSTATQISIFASDVPSSQSDIIRDVESFLSDHWESR